MWPILLKFIGEQEFWKNFGDSVFIVNSVFIEDSVFIVNILYWRQRACHWISCSNWKLRLLY